MAADISWSISLCRIDNGQRWKDAVKSQLRHLVAGALYSTKSYNLLSVCERYGLDPGTPDEAFSSKTRYVMQRLEKLSDAKVLGIAKQVVVDLPDDKLQAAVEQLEKDGHLISDLTRQHLAEALNPWPLAGKRDLSEMLRKYWSIDQMPSYQIFSSLADLLTAMRFGTTIGQTVRYWSSGLSYMLSINAISIHWRRRASDPARPSGTRENRCRAQSDFEARRVLSRCGKAHLRLPNLQSAGNHSHRRTAR